MDDLATDPDTNQLTLIRTLTLRVTMVFSSAIAVIKPIVVIDKRLPIGNCLKDPSDPFLTLTLAST